MLNNQKQLQLATFKICWKRWTTLYIKGCKMSLWPFATHRVLLSDFSLQLLLFLLLLRPLSLLETRGCCSVFLMLKRTESLVELTLPPYFTFLLVCCVVLIPIGRTGKCWLLLTPQLSEAEANQLPFNISRLLLLHPFTTWFLPITNVTLTLS